MKEFQIRLQSIRDVQAFVSMATTRPFTITIRDASNKINGQNFMEMFCLDFTKPLRVLADCTDAELEDLRREAEQFLVK